MFPSQRRHNSVCAERFIFWYGTQGTVFEPTRKTSELGGQLRRTRELVRTRGCPLWLCGAILPASLAASHLLGFHVRRGVLDTTHTRVGGSFLRFRHRAGLV